MDNPYTISTVDDPASYNQLITGRVDDLSILLTHIAQGRSIALVGERRIGKTSVLILLKDIINGKIEQYRSKLIDIALQNAVDILKAKLTMPCKAIYIDLQSLKKLDHEELAFTLHKALRDEGLLHNSQLGANSNLIQPATQSYYKTVIEVFQALQDTHGNERFVILLDEMECLQDFSEAKQIARNLRSIIQKCPKICMILTGADGWHNQIKDNTSRLANNIKCVYLKAASRFPIETYLVKGQLSSCLPFVSDMSDTVQTIMTWTECKPYYVQAICTEIFDKYHNSLQLPNDWKQAIEENVFQSSALILDYFYRGNNLDNQTKSILALLANQPDQTTKQIATRLGYSVKITGNKIRDMVSLDKITKQGSEYHILGTFIEKWGKQNLDVPLRTSTWPQRLKWVLAIASVALAIFVYLYTHPEPQTFSFSMPGNVIYIQMPASLEQDETGTAIVWVQNTSIQSIANVHVFLSSSTIDYQLDGTNQLTFVGLAADEKKSLEPTYFVHLSNNPLITSQVLISRGSNSTPYKYIFSIPRRPIPIQKYWFVISSLFTALSVFFSGKDLWQLVINLLTFLKGQNDASSKDSK